MADSVGRAFRGRPVLVTATLSARAGEVTVLFGRNGSGKTTALRIAAGVLRPDWGVVRFRGRLHVRPRLHRLARRGLMYVSQEGALVKNWTVEDHVRLLRRSDEAIAAWGARWRVQALMGRVARTLSGGERNRVGVALAVLRDPECLLLDEPFTGAAPLDRELVAAMVRHLTGRGCAVLATGHEAGDLLALSDRVIHLQAGSTRELGPPDEAVDDESFRREYLGVRKGG
ncbi:MAG TPA: ATP-binding cassette domain-containing protein [Longimicrobiales bacterium]|nr:ATP-binding cassette domain-containing protein [Longimicrobiales bacterium]